VPMDASLPAQARTALLAWFDATGRTLPFRASRDPYTILISEVMAQQTQIGRVAEKWAGFMASFPTVHALAAASAADVLRAWRGLGYNTRALNLQRAARRIVADHGGRVPSDLADLERLPGVGRYTARAVAALAYGQAVGPVDTNVRRVLQRVLAADQPMPGARLQAVADAAVPPERPADWTAAVMDLGATICRPAAPRCADCPLRTWCRYAAAAMSSPARRRPSNGTPFESTTRWVRGRIIDQLRDAPAGQWTAVHGPLGGHDPAAVQGAIGNLAREGLIERNPRDPDLVRLPAV
jgi:A/G-specific adenine glycosylase